jgi:DNA-binding winged helix-turn-helix (wHTH) protein
MEASKTLIPHRYLRFGQFLLDVEQEVLLGPQGRISLTRYQFRVLKVLAKMSAEKEKSWMGDYDIASMAHVAAASVRNHIAALRGALGSKEYIPNHSGYGYSIKPPASWCADLESSATAISPGPILHRETTIRPRDGHLAETTYYAYRTIAVPLMDSPELISHLEARYGCSAIRLGGKSFAVTALWQNERSIVRPDDILGQFDPAPVKAMQRSAVLEPAEYAAAREFIKLEYEGGPIKYEGRDYRMTRIALNADIPKIDGSLGLYYDSILTQYAMEWELKKALIQGGTGAIDRLLRPGALPLREATERLGNPMLNGVGRCAALTISTLLVFKRPLQNEFYCLIHRRSRDVGVSPGMFHVIPAGMFEQKNPLDFWSIEMNVWRELLEEVYNEQEHQGSGDPEIEDYVLGKTPIALLRKMIDQGIAEFSVTGICCDLLNIRPEICTILFITDQAFSEARKMSLNWEYEKTVWERSKGNGLVRWRDIDELIEVASDVGFAVGGAACLSFGRQWLERNHRL